MQPPVSKSAAKKLLKRQRYEQRKLEKREAEKAKRKTVIERKKASIGEKLAVMTEEEKAEWRRQVTERRSQLRRDKEDRRVRGQLGVASGQRIVVDLDFADKMSEKQIKSICHQLCYAYSVNIKAAKPAHLILTGVKGVMETELRRQVPGLDSWHVTISPESYIDIIKPDQLVYLTADATEELKDLDPAKAYIIGGIVDRNKYKGLCFSKAESQRISTAKLPIGEYMQLASSQVMCTNHVVEIMLKYLELNDWEAAFNTVIPSRKRRIDQ